MRWEVDWRQPLKLAAHSAPEGMMGTEQELSNALESALGDSPDSSRNAGWLDRETPGQEDQRTRDNYEPLVMVQAGCRSACPTAVIKGQGQMGNTCQKEAPWLDG